MYSILLIPTTHHSQGWNGKGIEGIECTKEDDIEEGKFIAERVFFPPLNWLMQCFCKSSPSNDQLIVSIFVHINCSLMF